LRGEVAVRLEGVVKRFPGVCANDHVDFAVEGGEIHALLGENGAGKTTLMNILYGIYQPSEGRIFVKGKEVIIESPRKAISLGIGMVHQHFKLVYSHSVAENIALGLPSARLINPAGRIEEEITGLSQKYGLRVDPNAKIWQLSAGEQQRVEIIKALFRGADVLILDEPTSVLTPKEANELFTVLRRMAEEGKAIIFITHKLEEVMTVSDRVTVLRQGRVVASEQTQATNARELAKLMVGREVLFQLDHKALPVGKVVLEVQALEVENDRGLLAVKDISLNVHQNEIVGIAGVAGNGQRELVEAITGLRKVKRGRVIILGQDMTNRPVSEIVDKGVAHIPEERIRVGTVPNMTIAENLVLKDYRRSGFSKGFFLNLPFINAAADKLISEYNVMAPTRETPARLLSGGNIQRMILARETSGSPKLIVAAHPTYGLDVVATEQIRQQLLRQRSNGAAILLVSEDLEEILSLSDLIAVMFEGRIMGIVEAAEADIDELSLMMAGVALKKESSA